MKNNILLAILLCFGINASADSLLDIYNDALENDPQYKSTSFHICLARLKFKEGWATSNISISAQTN